MLRKNKDKIKQLFLRKLFNGAMNNQIKKQSSNQRFSNIPINISMGLLVVYLLFCTGVVVANADYYKQGTLLSTNLLSGLEDVAIIQSFECTADVSASTTLSVTFSQDGTNWVNQYGYKGFYDDCPDGSTIIDLTALEWTSANLYYKLKFETANTALTPTVTEVKVNYSDTYTPPASGQDGYHKQGTVVSTNLLDGTSLDFFNGTEKFGYKIDSLPDGTTVQAQFSQDGINWYSSANVLWAWDTLQVGGHLSSSDAIDLSGLSWVENSFYYKLKFTTSDSSQTPVVSEIRLSGRVTTVRSSTAKPVYGVEVDTNHPLADGLVGAWIMNEGSGDTVHDSSGNGNDGTLVGDPIWTSGNIAFTDDAIDVGDNIYSGITSGYTMIVRCKPTGTAYGYERLIDKYPGPSIYLHSNADRVVGFYGTIGGATKDKSWGSNMYTEGVWQTLGVVLGNGYQYCYNDGVLVSNQLTGGPYSGVYADGGATNAYIGNRASDMARNFAGEISYAMVWLRALSADEIAQLYREPYAMFKNKTKINTSQENVLTSGLVGHWSFDGPDMDWSAASAEAIDTSGQGNDGDVVNGATPAIGISGQALEFDGVDDYIDMGDIYNGVKTIAFWLKANDITSRKIIDIDGTDQIEIDGSSDIQATSFPTATVYVDGAVASTITSDWHFITITDTTGVNSSAMDIGRVSSGYFDGLIDEVRIYNKALSEDEIGELYQAGTRRATIRE